MFFGSKSKPILCGIIISVNRFFLFNILLNHHRKILLIRRRVFHRKGPSAGRWHHQCQIDVNFNFFFVLFIYNVKMHVQWHVQNTWSKCFVKILWWKERKNMILFLNKHRLLPNFVPVFFCSPTTIKSTDRWYNQKFIHSLSWIEIKICNLGMRHVWKIIRNYSRINSR